MNSLQHHHRSLIRFGYSCFDRMIFHGGVQQFQHSERAGTIVWFLRSHRQAQEVTRAYLAKISRTYHNALEEFADKQGIEILEPGKDVRREELVQPYFQQLGTRSSLAVILKAREPERMAVHYSKSGRIAVERRHVDLYYFYLQDPQCGRMFLRVCPYFPFNITVWLNGHNWLASRLRQEGIAFEQRDNLFVDCADPQRLQELSDAFAPEDVLRGVESWLDRLPPLFSAAERQQGFRHQLYLAQVEYCHNLIFHQRVAVERLFDRLMDANRGLGHPDKLAIVFARPHVQLDTRNSQVTLKMTKRRTPVLSSSFKKTSLKQYISNGIGLRTESSSYQLKDIGLRKNIKHLPQVRKVLDTANQRYLDIQQDVLATYVDRGQLQQLRQPTVSPTGRRVPGLRLDDPRLLALLQAITCFAYLTGKGCFRTSDLLVDVQKALGNPDYTLSQLRYDLSKLRAKALVVRLPGTHSYRLTPEGYRLAILYLKLYQRFYAPLTAAIRDPVATDNQILTHRQSKLDRLYVAVDQVLKRLAEHLGTVDTAA